MSQESNEKRSTQNLYIIGAVVCFAVVAAFAITAIPKNTGEVDQRRVSQSAPAPDHSMHMGDASAPQEASVKIGDVMPDFTLTNLNANPGDPKEWRMSDNDGKYTLIFVADTKCSCVSAYSERLQDFHSKYQSKGVRVAFLYPQANETNDMIHQNVNQRGYAWPSLKDEGQQLAQALNIKTTTEAYLFDPTNRLIYRGGFDDNTFKPEQVTEHFVETALESAKANKPILQNDIPVKACVITRLPA